MTTLYTAVVFPRAGSAGYSFNVNVPAGITSYALVAPATATNLGALIPSTWNPFSSTAADRTQYWVDTAGTLTLAKAQLGCFGLAGLQAQQVATLTSSWNSEVTTVPVTIDGTRYILDNSPARQAQNVSYGALAQDLVSTTALWASGTVVPSGGTCSVNGVILFCSTAGTTASGAPTPPTAFGSPIVDGTAAWELVGRRVYLSSGTYVWMTPQNMLSALKQGELYLHYCNDRYYSLVDEVNAATTVSGVQSITW